jgi:ligand-binding SRPBCC domain-containing protein
MKTYRYGTELTLPTPLEEVFDFFSEAKNLEKLTPPWLRFEILTEGPIVMTPGAVIDYRISWRGIPLRWRTEIEVWEPPHRFVDLQIRGPYRLWRHEHLFIERDDGTAVVDRVEYAPFGGALANRLVVARDVERIFAYRHSMLARDFMVSAPR